MNKPKPGTKEYEEWMRKRAEERSKKLFSGDPAKFDERGIISGGDQSIHSTDAESFPDEPEEYTPGERKPKLVQPKE
jgi:hypothetical protein